MRMARIAGAIPAAIIRVTSKKNQRPMPFSHIPAMVYAPRPKKAFWPRLICPV